MPIGPTKKLTPHYDRDGITIYNADCRQVLPALADGSVDFIFTDPPYGHNNNNGDLIHNREAALGKGPRGEPRAIANDDAAENTNELVQWSFREWNRLLPPGACCCCCCCGGGPDPQFARWSLWLDEAVGFKHMVVWDKGPMGMGWHYRRSYEVVLVGEKPGAACRWYDTSSAVENIIRPGDAGIRKIIPSEAEHPTKKCDGLPKRFMTLHTRVGDLVLDPFMGGGGTLVVAKMLGRRAIGCELDRRWIDQCVYRLEQTAVPSPSIAEIRSEVWRAAVT